MRKLFIYIVPRNDGSVTETGAPRAPCIIRVSAAAAAEYWLLVMYRVLVYNCALVILIIIYLVTIFKIKIYVRRIIIHQIML